MIDARELAYCPVPDCATCLLQPRDGESDDAWKVRIRATLREQMAAHRPVPVEKKGHQTGDAAVLAVLADDTWTTDQAVADRLGLRLAAARRALQRARRRGVVEARWRFGYRRAS